MSTLPTDQGLRRTGDELLALIQLREDVCRDPDMTPDEQRESLKAIDGQIRGYLKTAAEDAGVVLRRWEAFAAADRKEAKYYYDRACEWERQTEWLKGEVTAVMQMIGTKRIEGAHGTFRIQKNPASVDVAQPELVPAPYQRITVTMSKYLYDRINQALFSGDKTSSLFAELQEAKTGAAEPVKSQIMSELKQGVSVPGCRLVDDRVRLVVE